MYTRLDIDYLLEWDRSEPVHGEPVDEHSFADLWHGGLGESEARQIHTTIHQVQYAEFPELRAGDRRRFLGTLERIGHALNDDGGHADA